MFYQTQNILVSSERQDKKSTAQKTPFRAGYALSGLVYCKHCGARYSANHGYYKCYSRAKPSPKFIIDPNCKNQHWKIEALENLVMIEIERLKNNKDYFNSIFNKPKDKIDNSKTLKQIKDLDIQLNKLLDLYQLQNAPVEKILERINVIQKEQAIFTMENVVFQTIH